MASPVFINHIATAVPEHDVHQAFIDYVPQLLEDAKAVAVFERMVSRAGIAHRYSVLAPNSGGGEGMLDAEGFYTKGHFPSTAQRMQLYKQHALPLARQALDKLDIAQIAPEVTHLIITSCTGFYAPGLDVELVQHYQMSPRVERSIIGFMGCNAAINGLKAAWHIVRSDAQATVAIINLELCTLHLQESDNLEQALSFLLFADGCSASILSAKPQGLEITGFYSTLISASQSLITWHIGNDGFDMHLSGEVPKAISDNIGALSGDMLNGESIESITHWAVHPGGRSILDAVQSGLKLADADLHHSRQILSDYGNMSSATVMFVLERILRGGLPGHGCAMAFGPGVSAETMRFVC